MPNTNRTLAELNTAIKTEMQLDPGLINDTERYQFLNDCLADLGAPGLFEKDADLTVEFGFATLPDDLIQIIDVSYSGHTLTPAQISNNPTGISTTPVSYIFLYNRIGTVPQVAACTLDLHYSYMPAKLALATDKPDIPNGWDKLLVDWAVGHAHRKNGNIGLYREYLGAYNEGKANLMSMLVERANSRVTNIHNTEYMETPLTPFDYI